MTPANPKPAAITIREANNSLGAAISWQRWERQTARRKWLRQLVSRRHGFGTEIFIFGKSNVPLHTARAVSKSFGTKFVGVVTVNEPDK
jgi:hypothetical protein